MTSTIRHIISAVIIMGEIALLRPVDARTQVPPDIATRLRALGAGRCVLETADIYMPLQQRLPYAGVTIVRDIAYGSNPRAVMDVFAPETEGGNRPVLIFVSERKNALLDPGVFDVVLSRPSKRPDPVFYDNIMFWAVKNGMTGVNVQASADASRTGWDGPAKDIAAVVDWIRRNIVRYKGDPDRIFLWASSTGNAPVSTYIAHPEISGKNGDAVKGVLLMPASNFQNFPEIRPAPRGAGSNGQRPGTECGRTSGRVGNSGAAGDTQGTARADQTGVPGPPPPAIVDRLPPPPLGAANGIRGTPSPPQADPATRLARSNLPGLAQGTTAVFLMWGELDPSTNINFNQELKDALCNAGRCPEAVELKDHNQMSIVFSPNTADHSVTDPILKWMNSVR